MGTTCELQKNINITV